MDLTVLMQAITSVGFPIVMCIILSWYIKNQSEQHKEETARFTEALNRNTLVLQRLCDKLDVDLDGGEK